MIVPGIAKVGNVKSQNVFVHFYTMLHQLLQPASATSSRDAECCLGQFSLVQVKASGSIKSNSAIKASVTLESCILDDKRPQSEEGVTR